MPWFLSLVPKVLDAVTALDELDLSGSHKLIEVLVDRFFLNAEEGVSDDVLADWGGAILDDLKDFVLSAHIEVIDLDDVFKPSIGLEDELDKEFAVWLVVVLHVFPTLSRFFEDGDVIADLLLDEVGDGVIVIDLVSELL